MTFSNFKYTRPDYDKIKTEYQKAIDVLNSDANLDEVLKTIRELNKFVDDIDSDFSICQIRYTLNTTDEFYEKENEYCDELGPKLGEVADEYNHALIKSKYLNELKKEFGSLLFDKIQMRIEAFDPVIVPLLIEEGKKVSEYQKIIANIEIEYNGQKLTIPQAGKFMESKDRKVRKEVCDLMWDGYKKVSDKVEKIYDDLVHLRNDMAIKLGYKNFIELGYKNLGRIGYNALDVKKYRDEIYKDIVPLATEILEKQRARLGLDTLYNYDRALFYKNGTVEPHGTTKEKLDKALKMYELMSNETGSFARFMVDHELLDLDSRKGKANGGYCTFISRYKAPFIFANFNNTLDDIGTLTHEFGHAFQVYQTRDFEIDEYRWPTLEACEIHSMSMEFFTWPYMNLFFDDPLKYQYQHLSESILFLPYGAAVDEFQHIIYENPNLTPCERKEVWRDLERKYEPALHYDNEFLNEGSYWIRQSHIFTSPFYYIDYTLAQNCAHQFFVKMLDNYDKAFSDYIRLCKLGGSKPFLELVKDAGLVNPFTPGSLKDVSKKLKEWLDSKDDQKL